MLGCTYVCKHECMYVCEGCIYISFIVFDTFLCVCVYVCWCVCMYVCMDGCVWFFYCVRYISVCRCLSIYLNALLVICWWFISCILALLGNVHFPRHKTTTYRHQVPDMSNIFVQKTANCKQHLQQPNSSMPQGEKNRKKKKVRKTKRCKGEPSVTFKI